MHNQNSEACQEEKGDDPLDHQIAIGSSVAHLTEVLLLALDFFC